MASEQTLTRVLDLLTTAPPARLESMRAGASRHAHSMRRVVDSDNVVAVGISEKVSGNEPTGKLALTFYVKKKISPKRLTAEMAIPPTVPEALSGPQAIPTDVVVLGKIVPELRPNVAQAGPAWQ